MVRAEQPTLVVSASLTLFLSSLANPRQHSPTASFDLLLPPMTHTQANTEQEFTIQPHPAKDNVPPPNFPGSDAEATPGLGGAPTLQHLHDPSRPENIMGGRGNAPHVPDNDKLQNLEQPKSREELRKLQASLNEEGAAGEL
ncbi:hypothetical protein JCM10296v2_006573 [Rhodotorula toruloides]